MSCFGHVALGMPSLFGHKFLRQPGVANWALGGRADAPGGGSFGEEAPQPFLGLRAMTDRNFAARALSISLSLAVLVWVVVSGIWHQSVAPETAACSTHNGHKRDLSITLPTGGTVTLQNFSNGAGGIMLTTRSVDPSLALAEIKC
jgi:hypothetical protein